MNLEWLIIITFLIIFFVSAILWFLFSYSIVPKIDKRMTETGESRACPVDIMGLRVLMIATAIGLPMGNPLNHDGNPLIDARSIRPYALKKEKLMGLLLTVTSYGWVIIGLVGSFFIPEAQSFFLDNQFDSSSTGVNCLPVRNAGLVDSVLSSPTIKWALLLWGATSVYCINQHPRNCTRFQILVLGTMCTVVIWPLGSLSGE